MKTCAETGGCCPASAVHLAPTCFCYTPLPNSPSTTQCSPLQFHRTCWKTAPSGISQGGLWRSSSKTVAPCPARARPSLNPKYPAPPVTSTLLVPHRPCSGLSSLPATTQLGLLHKAPTAPLARCLMGAVTALRLWVCRRQSSRHAQGSCST